MTPIEQCNQEIDSSSKFFRFAINYYGYHDSGTNEQEIFGVSYVLGALCISEIFWIIKIQLMAIKKLKLI